MKTIIITDHSCKLESSLKLLWRTTKLKNGNCSRINPASSEPLWSFDLKNYWIEEELMIAIIRGWWCWKGCTNLSNCRLCLIDAEVVLAYEGQWQNASLQNIVKISLQLAASWREKEHCKLGHQMHGLATSAFHSWINTIWYGNQSDAALVGPTKSSDLGGGEEEQIPLPLLQRMVKLCNQHLSSPGQTRETTDWYVLMTLWS